MKGLWILTIFSLNAFGEELYRGPCGGEGPHPWTMENTETQVRVIPTEGLIRDFVYWENRDAVVYRNEHNDLLLTNLRNHRTEYLNRLSRPLSRTVDNRERYLLTRTESWFLDTSMSNPYWIHFATFKPIVQHLYWQFNSLYSLTESVESSRQKMEVSVYRAGATKSNSCTLDAATGESFHLAKGHRFPWIYLYQTAPGSESGKSRLWLYRMRVRDDMGGQPCHVKLEGEFANPIYGNVRDVHFFEDGNVAIYTDHATQNLMWWTRTSCKYVHIEHDLLVPSHAQSTLFAFDSAKGLRMYFPDETSPIESQLFQGGEVSGITENDLWLSLAGQKLLVASKARVSEDRVLYEVNLKQK